MTEGAAPAPEGDAPVPGDAGDPLVPEDAGDPLVPQGDPPVAPPARTADQMLARAHLRLGSLALARVELETLAGLGALDTEGLADLAEVRWRTGDLTAAGEAAGTVLLTQPEQRIALVIAAEAAAAVGRPGEARRLATRALESSTAPIDAIFAGMPRAGVWPADAAEPPPTAGTLFHRETPEAAAKSRSDDRTVRSTGLGGQDGPDRSDPKGGAFATTQHALGFWDGDVATDPAIPDLPDPAGQLEAGRSALVAGVLDEAALRFGIALRLAPSLAPAVLEATDGARGTSLTVVRGDAYRLVGHESEAQRAYALAASGGLPERRRRPRPKPTPSAPPDAAEAAVALPSVGEVEAVSEEAPADTPGSETEPETGGTSDISRTKDEEDGAPA